MQTIRLTYESGLSLTLKLYDEEGVAVGEVDGYALTEVVNGEYQTEVADTVLGSPLTAALFVSNQIEATDYVWVVGEANSVAIVGVQSVSVNVPLNPFR